MARVGVWGFPGQPDPEFSALKPYALLLDQVHCFEIDDKNPATDFLIDVGFVRRVPVQLSTHPQCSEPLRRELSLFHKDLNNVSFADLSGEITPASFEIGFHQLVPRLARVEALNLRLFHKTDAVALCDVDEAWPCSVDDQITPSDLYCLLIKNLPTLEESVSWQDILAFKAEAQSQEQLVRLRHWVTDVLNGKFTFGEASDRITWLMNEYQAYMRGAGIKWRNGVLRTLVVATAEFIENAVKFRLGDIAKDAFELLDAKAQRSLAESNAPGRELAYLVCAKDRYKS